MLAKSLLVRVFGNNAALIHGDTLALDRWLWLRRRLFKTSNGERLIDIGCGTGAFSIGAALRGYKALGLSWDERNQSVARERALMCGAPEARFDVLDVRRLHERSDLIGDFDVAICFENVEHILDDRKLLRDIAKTLRPGGYLFLTTPYLRYSPMTKDDTGPFPPIEDGRHVRRGYTRAMLEELCTDAGLILESQSFCSGIVSQKITALLRTCSRIHPVIGWVVILPLRVVPPIFDRILTWLINRPYFSICIEAYKPKYSIKHDVESIEGVRAVPLEAGQPHGDFPLTTRCAPTGSNMSREDGVTSS